MSIIPILLIFIPIFAALLVYLVKDAKFSNIVFLAQGTMIVLFILYALFLRDNPDQALLILGGSEERIRISLYNDTLSLSFVGLTIGLWFIILMYTFNTNKKENKFLFFLMFLEGVFLGLIQTNDLFNLFVFLELMAVLVTILITYKKTGPSFRAGIYYLLLNTVGAMIFLIGIILIYYAYGTINIQWILANIALHSETTTVKLAYIFMISGISVKAALFPVFTWLPKAHGVAQSTISALLSGLIVKGALYMFLRINNEMFALANYGTSGFFFWLGAVTALTGVAFALSQKDLKQILAYSTISQIGIVMMGISSASSLSHFGGLLHIFNHAFFKSLLFLGAGVVIKVYHAKKIDEIKGVFRTMPWTAILLIVAMLAVSGAPLFNGYVSKTLIKYDFKDDVLKMAIFTLINLGTITYFIKFSSILFGPKQDLKVERNIKQHLSMTILAALCVFVGVFYQLIGQTLFNIDLSYVTWYRLEGILEYLLYVGIGVLLYTYVIQKDFYPIRKLRTTNITFESANYLFIVYLIILAIFVIGL
ncbi:MAG: complex I subunit 5 family protein [Acholeplasmataceae bacterium]